MSFKMKYEIKQDFLPSPSKRRSGKKIDKVGFLVAHDTGNDGSTAHQNVSYYKNSCNDDSASAHIFVDDKEIIECIPAFKNPEKAWHVLYEKPKDNQLFGDDANDIAIGTELCFSYKKCSIDNQEAYKRYIWVLAYLCYTYNLSPLKFITGHFILDPERKTDPVNALSKYGKTYEGLIQDVNKELIDCTTEIKPVVKERPAASVTSPAPKVEVKKYLSLPSTADSWRVYPLNKAPQKGNEISSLNPKKFNGLKYEILGNPQKDVYVIQTSAFGKVQVFATKELGVKFS